MLNGLRNKRVVVTAAASGIGRAVAQAFIAAHARVHVCDISADALSEFRSREPGLSATVADVSDLTAVDRFFDEALRELGGLDVLINNAGIAGPTAPVEDVTPEAWNRTMAVNLTGQFYCVRRAVPLLKQAGGGSIINIASTAGIMGYPLRTPYATSKWAVVGLTKSLAMELGPSGIRVNAVCPGSIEGERMQQVIAAEAQVRGTDPVSLRKSYEKQNSLRTFIAPEDIANMILFTCSDAGAKISGQALSVDGNTETLNN
ncbi:MAG: SDR family oxidoreductase [Gammaproteobacteria bacterium]|jgi:NAD(P)-dependent dehydrogenase (short-subunit alcohol dehydrogenase family)|nr:SDR family oxidoreductase [Gammaproteobacteria bacterium]